MGMPIGIDVRDPDVPSEALDQAFAFLRFVDATFSTWQPDSEISRINRGELSVADAHPDVIEVLQRCEQLRELTEGWFDIRAAAGPDGVTAGTDDPRDPSVRLPGAIEPSGLVKGWAVERAAKILEAHGARNFSVNAGGDIRLRGEPAPGARWRVGIQHPEQREAVAAIVAANELAIATSGAYERGEHVLDPHSGEVPTGVLSVSITGDQLATADAYATAVFAMGRAGADWAARLHGYEALVILDDGTMLSTPRFPFAPLA